MAATSSATPTRGAHDWVWKTQCTGRSACELALRDQAREALPRECARRPLHRRLLIPWAVIRTRRYRLSCIPSSSKRDRAPGERPAAGRRDRPEMGDLFNVDLAYETHPATTTTARPPHVNRSAARRRREAEGHRRAGERRCSPARVRRRPAHRQYAAGSTCRVGHLRDAGQRRGGPITRTRRYDRVLQTGSRARCSPAGGGAGGTQHVAPLSTGRCRSPRRDRAAHSARGGKGVGESTLQGMDRFLLQPSKLSPARQEALRRSSPRSRSARRQHRPTGSSSGSPALGANAFACPPASSSCSMAW